MDFAKIKLGGMASGSGIVLPVQGALPTDPYILKGADGLGPPEVDVFIKNTLYQGGIYQNRRPQGRQVIIRIGLNPDYTSGQKVSTLRSALYGLLTDGATSNVKIQLLDASNAEVAHCTGYISKFEVVPFSKDTQVQITIDCLEWFLVGPAEISTVPSSETAFSITNVGTAPAGFIARITFNATGSNPLLTSADSGKKLSVPFTFLTGDVLEYNTIPGQRTVRVDRGGWINLLGVLTSDSDWLQLAGGVNNFTITGGASWAWTYFKYTPQYWGV